MLRRYLPTLMTGCLLLGLSLSLSACGGTIDEVIPDDDNRRQPGGTVRTERGSVFGDGGLGASLFGGGEELGPGGGGGAGIGVNSFLWRATLDTVSFMPLASADPFGGVIITEWYSPPEASNERFKVNVFILGRDLRADGVRARVFRQEKSGDGSWVDAVTADQTPVDLENAILTRARELRIAGLQ